MSGESGMDKPIGATEYELDRALPDPLVTSLPTVEQLESELGDSKDVSSREPGGEE